MNTHAKDHTQWSTVAQIHQATELDTTINPVKDNVPTGAWVCQEANKTPQSVPVVKDMLVDAERKQEPESSSKTDADTETQLPGTTERE